MARCAQCGTGILFGGAKEGEQRFCGESCREACVTGHAMQGLAPEVVARAVAETLEGDCPVCRGPGPVDVYTSYRVHSLVHVTYWRSLPRISCRGCATKSQLVGTLYSFFLGWWGVPWGLLMTPVQIARNLACLGRDPDRAASAPLFEALVRQRLAREARAAAGSTRAA